MTTFVLVHGAWHDTWCWSRVRGRLVERGHEAVAVRLPSDDPAAGRADYVAAIGEALDGLRGVCLVAHSMSGLVAPYAAGRPEVTSLVLLAAMLPQPGASFQEQGTRPFAEPMLGLRSGMVFDDFSRSTWKPQDAADVFYADCTAQDAASAVALLRPDAVGIYGEPAPALPERRVPTAYVACAADRALAQEWNAALAGDLLGARTRTFASGHSPFWSRPADLADLLIAEAAG